MERSRIAIRWSDLIIVMAFLRLNIFANNSQEKFPCSDEHIWGPILAREHLGGKTKNNKIDSYKSAALLKGGNFPIAYSYPAKWRATRDLLRRRMYISQCYGELIAHIQNTNI